MADDKIIMDREDVEEMREQIQHLSKMVNLLRDGMKAQNDINKSQMSVIRLAFDQVEALRNAHIHMLETGHDWMITHLQRHLGDYDYDDDATDGTDVPPVKVAVAR